MYFILAPKFTFNSIGVFCSNILDIYPFKPISPLIHLADLREK